MMMMITSVLRELHWLPVRQRADFKLAVLVYKSLHDMTAPYLVDDCQLIVSNVGRHRLRSADIDTCIVPQINTRLGDRSFVVFLAFSAHFVHTGGWTVSLKLLCKILMSENSLYYKLGWGTVLLKRKIALET